MKDNFNHSISREVHSIKVIFPNCLEFPISQSDDRLIYTVSICVDLSLKIELLSKNSISTHFQHMSNVEILPLVFDINNACHVSKFVCDSTLKAEIRSIADFNLQHLVIPNKQS